MITMIETKLILEKDKEDLLKSRLERLERILNYKNRSYCKKYLKNIIEEFFKN